MKNLKLLLKISIILTIVSTVCYISAFIVLLNNNINIDFSNISSIDISRLIHSTQVSDSNDFSVDDIDNIKLHASNGNIDVSSWENSNVKLEISGYVDKNFLSNEPLNIYIDSNKTLTYDVNNFNEIYIKLYLPKNYNKNIDIDVSSADVNIKNCSFNYISLQSKSGDTSFSDLSSNSIVIQSNSGKTNLINLNSNSTNIQSTSGNINLDSVIGELNIKTSSSNVKGNISSFGQNNSINTSSGNIKLKIDPKCNFKLYAKTTSGHIDNDLKLDDCNYSKKELSGIYNSGENILNISSHSGNIDIDSL